MITGKIVVAEKNSCLQSKAEVEKMPLPKYQNSNFQTLQFENYYSSRSYLRIISIESCLVSGVGLNRFSEHCLGSGLVRFE
jgi:hypothetical protein